MKLNLIKQAAKHKPVGRKKEIFESVSEILGSEKAEQLFENFDVQPSDYKKWLEVIRGYAAEEGINIKRKNDFYDVAFAVLENDPLILDPGTQEAVVNTLWATYKTEQQHEKVQKVIRAKEEEEQLKYALRKMSGESEEEEEFLSGAGMEEEEDWDIDVDRFPEDEFDGDYIDQNDSPVIDDDPNAMSHDLDTTDFDSEEGMDIDEKPIRRDRQMKKSRGIDDFDLAEESEEHSSPFSKGQLVTCKKTGKQHRIEIPDGPGDMVGILVDGRIKMVNSRDIESFSSHEEEESTDKNTGKLSFLHDILTGEKTQEHLKQLQQKIENDGANAWTTHHAKLPKNPHPKGSVAYKAWERGVKKAAHEIWAPKKVEMDIKQPKAKKPTNKR